MESETKFVKVADVSDVPQGEGKVVHAGVKKVALFHVDGEFYAIQNYCPHAGGFLGLGSLKGTVVRCPRHSWGFDIVTGACKTNPRYETRVYPTKVEDGAVYVEVPDDGSIL